MRTFLVKSGADGRIIQIQSEDSESLKKNLLIGYEVVGESLGGVIRNPPLPDGMKHYSFLTGLLHDHGLELVEWLRDNGFQQVAEDATFEGSS